MRAVNLLPGDEAGGRQRPALPALIACFGTVVVTLVLAVVFLSASSNVGNQRKTLETLQAELAATPAPKPRPASALEGQLPTERAQRISILSSVLAERVAWDRVLRELAQVLPKDVWLTSLSATAPSTGPNAAASAFQLGGDTYSQDGVARLLSRLQVLPDLTQVQLISSTGDKIGNRPVVRFSISAVVRSPGATS